MNQEVSNNSLICGYCDHHLDEILLLVVSCKNVPLITSNLHKHWQTMMCEHQLQPLLSLTTILQSSQNQFTRGLCIAVQNFAARWHFRRFFMNYPWLQYSVLIQWNLYVTGLGDPRRFVHSGWALHCWSLSWRSQWIYEQIASSHLLCCLDLMFDTWHCLVIASFICRYAGLRYRRRDPSWSAGQFRCDRYCVGIRLSWSDKLSDLVINTRTLSFWS